MDTFRPAAPITGALTVPLDGPGTNSGALRHRVGMEDAPLFRLTAFERGLPGGDTPAEPGVIIEHLRPGLDAVYLPGSPGYPGVLTVPPQVLRADDPFVVVLPGPAPAAARSEGDDQDPTPEPGTSLVVAGTVAPDPDRGPA